MYEKTFGPKYDESLDVKEIAARVRAEIKAAVKTGTLPKGKYSVTLDRFSGGQSIDVRISNLEMPIYNPERLRLDTEEPHEYHPDVHYPLHTPEASALLKAVEEILQAYNYDGSDIQSDYFNVNFYGHTSFASSWTIAKRAEEIAALMGHKPEAAAAL